MRINRTLLLLTTLVILVGIVLRAAAAVNDFWLDEIWTILRLRQLHSPIEIFTSFTSSNNHHLYSLLNYTIGNVDNWLIYRVPAVLAGGATIALSGLATYQYGRLESFFTTTLVSFSYLMIHFSSEARGYTLVLFFGMACFLYIRRMDEEDGNWGRCVLFGICAGLGFLSHMMFIFIFISLFIWRLYDNVINKKTLRQICGNLAKYFLFPILFLITIHFCVLRHMIIGGSEFISASQVLLKVISYSLGSPPTGVLAIVSGAIYITSIIWGIFILKRKRRSEWIFFLFVIFITPGVILVIHHDRQLFVRYFLLGILFSYLVIGVVLSECFKKSTSWKIGVLAFLVLYLVGNSFLVSNLMKYGRGDYLNAMLFMADKNTGSVISVTSDNDFQNGLILEFYKKYLPPKKKLLYLPIRRISRSKPQWLIRHDFTHNDMMKETLILENGSVYQKVARFPYSDLSGLNWYIYQIQD